MPALLCLHQIWNQCMDKLYEWHKLEHKTDRVTDYAWRWIQDGRKQSAEYTVQNSRPFCGIVTTGTGSHHIVDLEAKTCTCHDFQDYEMPCDHAVALCMKQEREPEDFVSPIFTIAEYKATYQSFLHPIDLNVLAAADVKPPEFVVQAGRPKIRRERRKRFDLSKQRMRCSICKSFKHNRRTCDHSGPSASDVSASTASSRSKTASVSQSSHNEDEVDKENDNNSDSNHDGESDNMSVHTDISDWNGFSDRSFVFRSRRFSAQNDEDIATESDKSFTSHRDKNITLESEMISSSRSQSSSIVTDSSEETKEEQKNYARWAIGWLDMDEAQLQQFQRFDMNQTFAGTLQGHRTYKRRFPEAAEEEARKKRILYAKQVRTHLKINSWLITESRVEDI